MKIRKMTASGERSDAKKTARTGRRSGAKKTAVIEKRSMNLILQKEKAIRPARLAPLAAVAVVLALVVLKFGVYDRYKAVGDAMEALNTAQNTYMTLQEEDQAYDDVLAEYNRYSFGGMTADEQAVADRGEVMDLIETYLAPNARIESIDLTGNILGASLSGVTLKEASAILKEVEQDDLVAGVTVSAASTGDEAGAGEDKETTVTVTITLADNDVPGDTAADDASGADASSDGTSDATDGTEEGDGE